MKIITFRLILFKNDRPLNRALYRYKNAGISHKD